MEQIVYSFIGKSDRDEALQFLTHFIGTANNQYSYQNCYVAEEADQLLGQLCLYPGEQLEYLRQPILDYLLQTYNQKISLANETQAGERYIDTIAVGAHAQGKGIGKLLLQYVIDRWVHQEQQTLGLLVAVSNPSAKKLYLNQGFKVVGTLHIFGYDMEHLQIPPS